MTLKEKLLELELVVDNEYLDKYIELIENNKNTKKEKFKTQKHHIVPRYYFEFNKLDIDNSNNNLVNLLYKNHILAHYYLGLCSKLEVFTTNNFLSIQHITNNKLVLQNGFKEELIKFISSLDNYQDLYEKTMKDISNRYKGRIFINKGKEVKVLFDLDKLEVYLQNGWKLGNCEKITIHKNNRQKEITKKSLASFIKKGWLLGKLDKFDLNEKGSYCYFKKQGCHNIKVYSEYKDEYLKEGWEEYFLSFADKNKICISKSSKKNWENPALRKRMLESRKKYLKSIGKCVWVNNGSKNKRIPEENVINFLNLGWVQGKLPPEKIYVHNNTKNKLISKYVLDRYLNLGWVEGKLTNDEIKSNRKEMYNNIYKNKTYITKDGVTKRIPEEELPNYLEQGWIKGNGSLGLIKINDGKKSMMIKKSDLNNYLDMGFVKGELPKSKEWLEKIEKGKLGKHTSLRGSKYINKEDKELRVKQSELDYYLSNGWNLGRRKINK